MCRSLLLSGLRESFAAQASSVRIPPALVRLALVNSSLPLAHLNMFDQGHGLFKVDGAFNYLTNILYSSSCRILYGRNVPESSNDKHVSPQFHPSPLPGIDWNPTVHLGWRLRCTVSGPGLSGTHRGIWLRRGWIPKVPHAVDSTGRSAWPVLRYTVHLNLDFDQHVPLNYRRQLELQLVVDVMRHSKSFTAENGVENHKPCRPSWLQVASLVSVTSLGRDITLIIDPNRFWSPVTKLSSPEVPRNDQNRHKEMNSQDVSVQSSSWSSALASSSASTIFPSCEPQTSVLTFTDSNLSVLGVLAHLPIVVHLPIQLQRTRGLEHPRLSFSDHFNASNKVRRWFVDIPSGATAGIIRLARLDKSDASCEFKVTIHMPQPKSGLTPGEQEITWPLLSLNWCGFTGATLGRQRGVTGRRVGDDFDGATQLAFPISWEADYLELTIAQHWGLEAPAVIMGELHFRGLEPSLRQLSLSTSDHYTRLGLRSNFGSEDIAPCITLTHWVLPLRPSDSHIFYRGHGQNEILLSKRSCYSLRLVYRFSCPFKYSLTHFEMPWLHDLLYESDYLVQLYHIYDSRDRVLGAGDFDVKRSKRPKFALSLDKGDYKVVVEICHETGPSLTGTLQKSTIDPVSRTTNACASERSGGITGGDTIFKDCLTPLERLRHHCALVRFRLPASNPGSTVDFSPNDRINSRTSSNVSVTFEYSAYPFSLGMNCAKPCSALDPLPLITSPVFAPHGPKSFMMVENADVSDISAESNRRCPCLPTSLGAKESTSVYIGLADQRYPSYTTPGSYFNGTIGYYNSDVLQNVVTYPFRLIVDSLPSVSTPSSKPPCHHSDEEDGQLVVGSLGLSVEDFEWLLPLETFCFDFQYPASTKTYNRSGDAVHSKGSPDYTDNTKPCEGIVPSIVVSVSDRNANHDMTDCPPDWLEPTAPTVDPVVSCLVKCSLQLNPTDSLVPSDSQPSEIEQTLNSCSQSDVEATVTHETSVLANGLPSADPVTDFLQNQLKVSNRDMRPKSPLHRSLSTQLAAVHEQLVLVDSPLTSSLEHINLDALRSTRESVWLQADRLILGHVSGKHFDGPEGFVQTSSGRPKRNMLHYLLTMRLVSPQQTTQNANSTNVKFTEEPTSESPHSTAVSSEDDVNDPAASVDAIDAITNVHSPTSPVEQLDDQQSKTVRSNGSLVFSYIELKLRLIDTLARYGRLLCERILCTADTPSSSTSEEACLFNVISPDSHSPGNSAVSVDSDQEQCRSLMEYHEMLASIHTRLIQLVTSTATGSNAIGEMVRIGAQALPAWLLISGIRDLRLKSGNDKAFELSRMRGTVGGRLLLFFLLYSIVNKQYPQALRLLTRLVYQIEEPPAGAHRGVPSFTKVASMGHIRPVFASFTGSFDTSKRSHYWLIWLLHRLGWIELGRILLQQTPSLFPERDFSVFYEQQH